jgi:hypothetical protein
MLHKPQYLDVLSSEIEKNLYKFCLLYIYKDTFIYIIQILYRFFSIISLEKNVKILCINRARRFACGRNNFHNISAGFKGYDYGV